MASFFGELKDTSDTMYDRAPFNSSESLSLKWAENNMFLPKDIVNPAMWARKGFFFFFFPCNNNHSPTFFLTDLMFESLKRRVLE